MPGELPLYPPPARPRADRTRNHRRVLAAAEQLFSERRPGEVSMDDVAARAGVGKGTLYRHFGDRSGLAAALLGEWEHELQEQLLRGPPPIGPGAPPQARLLAFVDAHLDLVERNTDLRLVSETAASGARFRTGIYSAWHQHVAYLIGEARPDADAELLAHELLAGSAADMHRHLREVLGVPLDRVKAARRELAAALLNPRSNRSAAAAAASP